MKEDYDKQADRWKRNGPRHLGDFLVREKVAALMKKISKDKIVLDLGCGEGYVSRKLKGLPKKIIGVDNSKGMIELAKQQEKENPIEIEYHLEDARNMKFLQDNSIDICMCNLLTNYFTPEELPKLYSELARVLKKDGKFIIGMTHPVLYLPQLTGSKSYDVKDKNFNYIKSRGKCFKITIETIVGKKLNVELYHSTIEDHFKAISKAGLAVEMIKEPVVSQELANKHPLFSDLVGTSAYMIMIGTKL